MCRLYALRANEPTRVECSLVRAQNALMAQSRADREGVMHGHGWGVADYADGAVTLTLVVGPAMKRRCAISHISATAFQPWSSSMPSGCISDFL